MSGHGGVLQRARWHFGQLFLRSDGSLRSRVLQGGGVLLAADVYSNLVRLAGNLIMTRLLFPEAFGLMLIVNLVFGALDMLSDLGVRGAVIVKKGDLSKRYIDTAWTIMILRGVVLGMIALLLAAPIAQYYQQPELFGLIAIASLAPVINGFASPYPMLDEKNVRFSRVVIWRAVSQTGSVFILVVWLWFSPSIWALAATGVIAAVISTVTSFRFFPAPRPSLTLDRVSTGEIYRLGRWIVIASGLTFLARQGDSLIISKWVTVEQLGVFSIAIGFAKLVEMLVERLSWSLLFPVYAEIQAGDNARFNAQLRKVKFALFGICSPLVLLFALFGRDLINLLYDSRYLEAGWMLEIMAAGSVFLAAGAAIINIPMSFGDSYRHMWLQFFRFSLLLVVMYVGGQLAGVVGLVAGIAVAQALYYPVLRIVTHRYGVRDYSTDLLFVTAMLSVIALVWNYRGWPMP